MLRIKVMLRRMLLKRLILMMKLTMTFQLIPVLMFKMLVMVLLMMMLSLVPSLSHLRGYVGPSWALSWPILRLSWAILGPMLAYFGSYVGPFLTQKRSKNDTKKTHQKMRLKTLSPVACRAHPDAKRVHFRHHF